MNKKALSLAICLAMAIPTASNALSLGEIESKSSLNQPFQGRINLLSTSVAEAQNLRVRVASPEVFNRVGIDRPAFLNSIRFRTTTQNGRPVILVSSTQPINEPFLNFLLEVSWPNGQLLKEYTVLLDPPVLMRPNTAIAANNAGVRPEPRAQGQINRPSPQQIQQQRQRQAAQQARQTQQAQARRSQQSQLQQAARRLAAAPAPARSQNYRVRRGDTLSKVASRLAYRGVSKDQMMIALFEKNSRAFSQRNMNNLKSGALLTRPSLQEARSTNSRAAKSQIIAQAREWKQKRAELLAKKRGTKVAAKETARLEVMGKSGAGASSAGSASGNGDVAKLNQQITELTESLTSRQKENEELKSRISELESLLRKKNKLITLKSEQLASLQEGLGNATGENSGQAVEEQGAEEQAPVTENQPVVNENNIGTDIQEQVAGNLAEETNQIIRTPAEETTAVVEEQPVIEEQAEVVNNEQPASPFKQEQPESSSDILSLLGSPTALGIGGGSLLALIGGLLYMRRRKNKDEEVEDFSSLIDDGLKEKTFDDSEMETVIDNDDMIDESEYVAHDEVAAAPEEQAEAQTAEDDANHLDDLIQEADVYIVYGLHDQAESEIKRAINQYPNNAALHAKLLENYKAAGDKDAFEENAKAFLELDATDKENYWDEICEWGKQLLPESKLFEADALEKSSGAAAAAVAAGAGAAMVAGKAVADAASDNAEATEESLDDIMSEGAEMVSDAAEEAEEEFERFDIDMDDEIDDLNNFNLDDVLAEDDEQSADVEEASMDDLEVQLDEDDEFDFNMDEDVTPDVAEIDEEEFALKEDSLEGILDENIEENMEEADSALDAEIDALNIEAEEDMEGDMDLANLSLDIDAEDFDKIMPEDHAYKSEETKLDTSDENDVEDNLLADFDDNLSFLDLEEESEGIEETQIETKIDLAKAYIDMGDIEGARNTLEEVIEEGSEEQKREAEELLQNHG